MKKKPTNVNTLQSVKTESIDHDKATLLSLKVLKYHFFLELQSYYIIKRAILKILETLRFWFK